jgi:hypothetical protein
MTTVRNRVAIVFPGDAAQRQAKRLEQSRLAGVAKAFTAAGAEVVGAPYADAYMEDVRAQLLEVDAVLVWFNPTEGGRDRSMLNTMLRDVASKGVLVSAHPDVIDRIGTKEVLYRTRSMGWGCDTRLYPSVEAMRDGLPASLASGPKVLKQIRGQSGDGVWKVELANPSGSSAATVASDPALRVRHAQRGSIEQGMSLDAFLALCRPYFAAAGGMIDQPYQARLNEGMVRCYMVRDQVEGFGEQLINALYPAPPGGSASDAPQPGPRLYFPPDRPDFQRLKQQLEREWVAQLCAVFGLQRSQLPVLWDADFLYGPKDAGGGDTYVLCEINVSSVYPFPPSALAPLVTETLARIESDR